MKINLFLAVSVISLSAFAAQDRAEMIQFWMDLRYQGCSPEFNTTVDLANPVSIGAVILSRACKDVDFKKPSDPQAIKCFKAMDTTLEHSLSSLKPADQGCQPNPGYKAYLNGEKTELKKVDPQVVGGANDVCRSADGEVTRFKYGRFDHGESACTARFKCLQKFIFGKSTLEQGTYNLRCNASARSQKDCDQVSLSNCSGNEVSYTQSQYLGFSQTNSTKVSPSVKTGQ